MTQDTEELDPVEVYNEQLRQWRTFQRQAPPSPKVTDAKNEELVRRAASKGNKMNNNLENFSLNNDHTGRFMVTSFRTGRTYYIEAIDGNHVKWGDMDPVTKKLTGDYGQKYHGAIEAEDSLITQENGFSKIHDLEPGISPLGYIEKLDAKYPDKE